jgi:hypothetical protein
LADVMKPKLDAPEVNCMERCAFKYHEAIKFGFEVFKYLVQLIKLIP